MAKEHIVIDQLCIGLYVDVGLSWMDHPFLFRNFKVRDAKQLAALKNLGLKEIVYDPSKSDAEPLPLQSAHVTAESANGRNCSIAEQMWEEKRKRIQSLKERRRRMRRCDNCYRESASLVKHAMKNLLARPEQAIGAAADLIGDIVNSFMVDKTVALNLVNIETGGENTHHHVINVLVLSMMLGKEVGLGHKDLHALGLGVLFHDIGKMRIPDKVVRKIAPLTKAERQLYELHPRYGVELAAKSKVLPQEAIKIIAQHHEAIDGSGYPKNLKGIDISPLAKIVAIANTYDTYCNKPDPKVRMTPYEAVSHLYAKEQQKFDKKLLSTFISFLGVYPPGTVVELSDSHIGIIVSTNPGNLLRPNVLLYEPDVPKDKAVFVDMREEDERFKIVKSIRPLSLPEAVSEYLMSDMKVNYYFEPR